MVKIREGRSVRNRACYPTSHTEGRTLPRDRVDRPELSPDATAARETSSTTDVRPEGWPRSTTPPPRETCRGRLRS